MRWFIMMCALNLPLIAHAFEWSSLWQTPDQKAKKLMDNHQFTEASQQFEDMNWRATAAYRAGQFDKAAADYQTLQNEEGFYNQGNARAKMGQYEKAVDAYRQALKLNPNHRDAQYNLKLVEDLLKKNKQNQDKQNQDKQNQDKQDQDKQNQDKQDQDKQNQDKQDQDKQNQDKQDQDKQNQDKQDQDKQDQDKQNQDKQDQDKQNQDKQDQDKQDQDKQDQDKQDQDKQDQDKQDQDKQNKTQSPAEREKQRANEQWLKLIPDDPGGLLREKFMRDHLRRQNGWDQ